MISLPKTTVVSAASTTSSSSAATARAFSAARRSVSPRRLALARGLWANLRHANAEFEARRPQ